MTHRHHRRPRRRHNAASLPLALHVASFRFTPLASHTRLATILVRGRIDQASARRRAYAKAREQSRDPWLTNIRTVPAPRATPALDRICRTHTAFARFLDLVTAPAGYCPSIRLDLMGRDGVRLARAYDATQAAWGDPRRAFVTGVLGGRRRGGGRSLSPQ
jgi:hypothetical protein